MEEYEYSLKVKDIKDFITYCKNNDYKIEENYNQERTLYKKENGNIMGRITKNIYNDRVEEILDFKTDNLDNNILKVQKETKKLKLDENNREFVMSLLNILELNNKKVLKRKRTSYIKNNVKFEIDEYFEPSMKVLAIEGKKEEVDEVYNLLADLIEKNKVSN